MEIPVESILQDVWYAFRALVKSPAFTAIVVLTLALGIAVNTAIFSVVYGVLLRPLPYDRPEQLGFIWSEYQKSGPQRANASGPLLVEVERRNGSFQSVAGIWVGTATFAVSDEPEQVKTGFVTPNFLTTLGVRPILGRLFTEQDRGRPAVILGHAIWQERFGADRNIIGKGVRANGFNATVVGIMPKDFRLYFPADSNVPADVQAFAPFGDLSRQPLTLYYVRMLARLRPGVNAQHAQDDLRLVARELRQSYTAFAAENLNFQFSPMQSDAVRDLRPALIVLFACAGLVLLICCVNVANLLIARTNDRCKEIGIRSALGASQVRVVLQLLIEGLVLCAMAASAGLGLGWTGIQLLQSIRPDDLFTLNRIALNWPVLVFVAAISLTLVLLFGLAPGLGSLSTDLMKTLRDSGRVAHSSMKAGARSALIVSEVTLSVVLVITAGLMIRSLEKIRQVRPGFNSGHLLTFEVDLPDNRYASAPRIHFVKEWETQLASLPGVEAEGAISHLPLDDYPNWFMPYRPEGLTSSEGATLIADHRCATIGFLQAMGVRLLEGRYFEDEDRISCSSSDLI
jgi:putative ABC transport system permease protein